MGNFLATRTGKVLMNYINGFGAATVIVGAMFKILHFPGGSFVIGLGLAVEATIFALSAFDPVHEELDWTKVHPELKGEEPAAEGNVKSSEVAIDEGLSAKLDGILAKAEIDVDKLRSLERSISRFSDVTSRISEVVVSQSAAQKYNKQINDSIEYMDALNAVYAKQVEQRTSQMEMNQKIFEDMYDAMETNKELQYQMQKLVINLNKINSVYQGMVDAMTMKSNQ